MSMKLRPTEITSILKDQIENYDTTSDVSEVGTVVQVGDGIARIHGITGCAAMEMLEFPAWRGRARTQPGRGQRRGSAAR